MTEVAIHPNPLRLTHCMRCGYSLETLAPEGTCPECGLSYDQGTVVLKGMWAGNGGAATGSPGSLAVPIGMMCFLVFEAWTRHWGADHFDAIVLILVFSAGLAVELAFWFTARRAADGGALLHCRFNRFGCLQCDVPEETTGALDYRRIWRSAGLLAIIAIACQDGQLPYWLIALGAAVGLCIEVRIRWRRHRTLRLVQRDPDARALMVAARDRGRQVPATPWSAISEIRVGQFRGKPFRVRSNRFYLKSMATGGKSRRDSAIDAEVEATVEQIRELQSRIAGWQSAARAKAGH